MVIAVLLVTGCGNDGAAGGRKPDSGQADMPNTEVPQREVTLAVPDMNCPMCPITLRKALAGVDGVTSAEASLDEKQARVVFDSSKTGVDALIAAVAEAGFTATRSGDADE
ncbi:MAG TPA: cation transporter [Alphaproteobacteria bacterium]|nr:cation transporter [Alphaproteobacteria bacterium]